MVCPVNIWWPKLINSLPGDNVGNAEMPYPNCQIFREASRFIRTCDRGKLPLGPHDAPMQRYLLSASGRYSVSRIPIDVTAEDRHSLSLCLLRNDLDHPVVLDPAPGCQILNGKDEPLAGRKRLARKIGHLQAEHARHRDGVLRLLASRRCPNAPTRARRRQGAGA